MALDPQKARASHGTTPQEIADWLEIQIDAWLTSAWHEPSTTCFHIPPYLKHHVQYAKILELLRAKYRSTWPLLHTFSTPAYTCDFFAFVTKPCGREQNDTAA